MINKRNLTVLIVLISVALLSTLILVRSFAQGTTKENLFGSWYAEVTVEAQDLTFPALITFGSDGTVITDEPPSPGETSGHGNWVIDNDGEVAYTFIALFSGDEAVYAGNLKVSGALTYDTDSDSWQGPFVIRFVDADGQPLFNDTGTFSLTRIAVESID